MSFRDQAFDDWIERGRLVRVRAELERRGLWSRKMLGDAGNPCPGCEGTDRFAVNLKKNLFFCRKSGAGGDAIALVRHIDDVPFLRAVEILTGEPPPSGQETASEAERAARVARLEERARAQAIEARRQQAEGERYRAMERRAAFDLWLAGTPIGGTMAAAYLRLRGLDAPPEARLRFKADVSYFAAAREYDVRPSDADDGRAAMLFAGPALLAAIQGADGAFIGIHRTWLDLDRPDGKRLIRHPQTGAILPAKKVRGSKRGGTIRLAGHPKDMRAAMPGTDHGLALGEGIETVLSAFTALAPEDRRGLLFAAAVDLGNLAGKAQGRVPHPIETKQVERRGKVMARRVFVPGAVPDPDDDTPLIGVPDGVTELVLLGDGDSEPVRTKLALHRAATRFADAYPGLTVRLAMARDGLDFNGMLREAA